MPSMSNQCDAVAFIFARGGSKGLPGKNIRMLAGKPLIAWAIEHSHAVQRIRRVIVSTDSEEIAAVAAQYGAEVPFLRPSHLARDNSPEWLSWRHALEFIRNDEGSFPDVMVSVPVTAPLRQPADIERCLERFSAGDADVVVTVTDAYRNPFFNMVTKRSNGSVELVFPPSSGISCRQDAPEVFDMTTVAYVADPEFVMKHESAFAGRVKAVHVPNERSIDIDTLLDFEMAEFLFARGN
ncbi:acylneuraminate cytidylyltransferase family protein [Candidatus Puniceispirillum sp.]|nr:acylneuraminate cytidylyltransferase family protein [Candidatus Puniceispirillum sp.]